MAAPQQPRSAREMMRNGVGTDGTGAYADSYAYRPVATGENKGPGVPSNAVAVPPQPASAPEAHPPKAGTTFAREMQGLYNIIFTWLNLLLVFVPTGIYLGQQKTSSAAIFTSNFMAIVPLAGILGAATESLAIHTGQMIGGLLNATFGNAVEMIVTVQALRSGLIRVVQGSLLGSILSNLLLVLGMAFFAGGVRHKEQTFNAGGASTNTTCLILSSIALALPTIYHHHPNTGFAEVLIISRICACVVSFIYCLFLVFQLKTHLHLFQGEEDEDEEAELSAFLSIVILAGTTVVVSICSDYLVDSIEGVTEEYGMPQAFIGVILLPIVGNAAEHATAVTMAMKGKMDLSLGVAVGSSTQIALFMVPFSVIIGWGIDVPMTLDFRSFDSCVMLLSVFLVSGVLHDGSSNWFEGVMLMATYVLIAIIIWFIPAEDT